MKRVPVGMLIAGMVISLLVGGIAGFFLGIGSTKVGARFLEDLVEEEQQAETGTPKKLGRARFELLYPANWKIDTDDEDYHPDQMFSIDSPGSAYVMFMLDDIETNPEDNLQHQINGFSRMLDTMDIQPFKTYGQVHGKGAILRGTVLGTKITVKTFACYSQGMTAIIVQQYPDEDVGYVKDGFRLIEESFILKPGKHEDAPNEKRRLIAAPDPPDPQR